MLDDHKFYILENKDGSLFDSMVDMEGAMEELQWILKETGIIIGIDFLSYFLLFYVCVYVSILYPYS